VTQPRAVVVFALILLAVHLLNRPLWLHVQTWAFSTSPVQYDGLRQHRALSGLPIGGLASALDKILSRQTPLRIAPALRRNDFVFQRLAEGLYPRRLDDSAENELVLDLGTENVLIVWPGRGHFRLAKAPVAGTAQEGIESAKDPPIHPSTGYSWLRFFIQLIALCGLGFGIVAILRSRRLSLWPSRDSSSAVSSAASSGDPSAVLAEVAAAALMGGLGFALAVTLATWFRVSIPLDTLVWIGLVLAALKGVHGAWCSRHFLSKRRARSARDLVRTLKHAGRNSSRRIVSVGALAAAFIVAARMLVRLPIVGWDGRSIWFFRAHQIVENGGYSFADVTNSNYLFSHPSYPLFFPSWLAAFGTFASGDGFSEQHVSLGLLALVITQVTALWCLLAKRVGYLAATLGSLAFLTAAFGPIHNGYPDMVVTGFLLIAVVALTQPETLAWGLLACMAAALTKREGFVLALGVLAFFSVLGPAFRGIRTRRRILHFTVFAPAVGHTIWYRRLGLPEIYQAAGAPPGAEIRRRLISIVEQFVDLGARLPIVQLSIAAVLIVAVWGGLARTARNGQAGIASALFAFAFTAAAFVFTPFGFQWHMDRAFDRLVVHGCWIAVGTALCFLAQRSVQAQSAVATPPADGPQPLQQPVV